MVVRPRVYYGPRDYLKQRGVPVWYLMAKDEGHGFRKKSNQDFQFYATILFTERYLTPGLRPGLVGPPP